MSNLNKYNYYAYVIDNKEVILRISSEGTIHKNVSTIQVYKDNTWINDGRITKSFMSDYLTGWVSKHDILDAKMVMEALVTGMSYRTVLARKLAIKKHNNQKYGVYPYEVHLTNVVNVLLHFGVTFENDVLIMSAWLHDIFEDTDIEKTQVSSFFGEEVRNIVELVSNQKDFTKTIEENKRKTFENIITNQNAIIIKLADRIANIEFSLLHGSIEMIEKYKKEQIILKSIFESKIETKIGANLYQYLKSLLV